MKKLLYIDCCIRREYSRTKKLAEAFLDAVKMRNEYEIETLCLPDEGLTFFADGFFDKRQELLENGDLDHPRFRYAHAFADADRIVIAAPFWDLTFPALLKVYIENINVDGITFFCDKDGAHGKCKAEKMMYLTTRGGACEGTAQEVGIVYLREFCKYVGIGSFEWIAADGIDLGIEPAETILRRAMDRARHSARTF